MDRAAVLLAGHLHTALAARVRDPGAMMRQIDYDVEQYQHYARGRALTGRQLQAWISAFTGMLPCQRPLRGLDVGSGTGRFTPALAQAGLVALMIATCFRL